MKFSNVNRNDGGHSVCCLLCRCCKLITSLWPVNHSGQEYIDPKLLDYCSLCKPHHKNGFYYLTVFVDFVHHTRWESCSMIQLFHATNVQYEDKYDMKYKSHHNNHAKHIFFLAFNENFSHAYPFIFLISVPSFFYIS